MSAFSKKNLHTRLFLCFSDGPRAANLWLRAAVWLALFTIGTASGALLFAAAVVLLGNANAFLGPAPYHWKHVLVVGAVFFVGHLEISRYLVLHRRKLWLWLLTGMLAAALSAPVAMLQIGADNAYRHQPDLRLALGLAILTGMTFATWLSIDLATWQPVVFGALANYLVWFASTGAGQAQVPPSHAFHNYLLGAAIVGAVFGAWRTLVTLRWCFGQHHVFVGDLGWLSKFLLPLEYLGLKTQEFSDFRKLDLNQLSACCVVYAHRSKLTSAVREALVRRGCTVIKVPTALSAKAGLRLLLLAQHQLFWALRS